MNDYDKLEMGHIFVSMAAVCSTAFLPMLLPIFHMVEFLAGLLYSQNWKLDRSKLDSVSLKTGL